MEIMKVVTVKGIDLGVIFGIRLIAFGIALDTSNNDEYYFSLTIGLGPLSFNVAKPKVSRLMEPKTL